MAKFPFYQQPDQMFCGPTCLRIIAKHYGRAISFEKIGELAETTRQGSTLGGISEAAEKLGFRTLGIKLSLKKMQEEELPLPCILFWRQNHFVVLYKIKKHKYYISDPAHGLIVLSEKDFINAWIGENATAEVNEGIALLLEPTPKLAIAEEDDVTEKKGFRFLYQYLFRYKKFVFQLILGLIAGSLLQLIFPFLTQSVVDIGIQNQDINFIYLILIAQLFLFAGRTGIELIRGWILLHLSTRINISLISDFFIKLMNLPIAFFDSKMTGDIMQRISDHQRIENLLTTSSLNILFSTVNLIIFGAVLAYYDMLIFTIFLVGSALYLVWVTLFLKRRKALDYKRFEHMSDEQSKVMELINGMQEIKLHNAERQKRWGWEYLQARLFKVETKNLVLEQTQSVGANVINELKNIFITILAAKLVIDGEITLGMMMAITYIIGQLNGPIQNLIQFVYVVQDAKIALERLSQIHNKEDEEKIGEEKNYSVSLNQSLHLNNISFRYPGNTRPVIEELSLEIPPNKITAIVGASGSGKTTLMKILLKFYEVDQGEIKLGPVNLNMISQKYWRDKCGVVMQEGYIFNDTIANNIAIGQETIDIERLIKATKIANIHSFIQELPLGFNTKIGMEGVGMSTGQKQRMLIARAVYKNPEIICFDEATSALDAKNEKIIMQNLDEFFKDRTAIVIAHRLSTVKNADQIVVLDEGDIIEQGTHDQLVAMKGSYYALVKNQLDLEKLNSY